MKVDCKWFSANLEAYFCESLGAPELQLAVEHMKTCLSCRSEVQALRDVDPMIKELLEFRMTKAIAGARAPRRGIGFQIGLGGAAVALVAILVFVVFLRHSDGPDRLLPTGLQSSASQGNNEVKVDGSAPAGRAKPDAPDQKSPAVRNVPEPVIPEGAPDFLVSDAAGYTRSLQDYRGRVLLVGVWSADQPEAAQNLQRLYQAFGNRKEVRILGVTSRNEARVPGITTFPTVFNNGSRLLDTRNSSFVVVDKEGVVQMRDSLVGDSNVLIPKVEAKLNELGGR